MTKYQQYRIKVNKSGEDWYIPVPSDMIKELGWKNVTEVKLRTSWYEDEGGVIEVYRLEKQEDD